MTETSDVAMAVRLTIRGKIYKGLVKDHETWAGKFPVSAQLACIEEAAARNIGMMAAMLCLGDGEKEGCCGDCPLLPDEDALKP